MSALRPRTRLQRFSIRSCHNPRVSCLRPMAAPLCRRYLSHHLQLLSGVDELNAFALVLESARRIEWLPDAILALVFAHRRSDLWRRSWDRNRGRGDCDPRWTSD